MPVGSYSKKAEKLMKLRIAAVVVFFALASSLVARCDAYQSPFTFRAIVHAGDAAPVPAQLSSVLESAFNDQGQVALSADRGIILKSGSQTIPIVATGDPAPGGGFFFSVDSPSLSPQGQVVFRGSVSFPGTSGLYEFSSGTISLLIADGTTSTGGQSITPGGASFVGNGDMLVNDAFSGALFLFSNGALTRLVGPGDSSPGGAPFVSLVGGVMNQTHQVAFEAFLSTGGNGIFLLSGGTISKIIAAGDIMSDGVPFGFADAPTLNDSGDVVFGGISNSLADSGIFSFSNGHLSLLIPRLARLPNGSFLDVPFTTSLNDAGEVAFSASDTNGNNGVFLFANGQISSVETDGQPAPEGGTFKTRTEVGAIINASGQVLFFADRIQHGNALYLFSNNALSRVIGQGDFIPRQPTFEFPTSVGIGDGDRVLISDSTFPGGNGAYTAIPTSGGNGGQQTLAIHVGQAIGVDGVVDFLFGFGMNQQGQVAADVASSDAKGALLLNTAGSPVVLLDSSPSSAVDPGGSAPAINDLGNIAFNGFAPGSGTSGVFLDSNGQTQLLLSAATQLPGGTGLNNITNLALNNQDALAFVATPAFPAASFFLFANGQLTALANNGDPAPGGGNFQIFFPDPSFGPVINNRGDVVFASSLTGTPGGVFGSSGVYLFSNGNLSRIVGPNDPSPDGGVFLDASFPSVNAGDIAFFAETSKFNFGVFLFHADQIIPVVLAGDMVNGEGLSFATQPVLNNNGDIAFTATLLDGRNAILVASGAKRNGGTPTAVSSGEILWQKKMRDLEKLPRPYNHPGPNVRMLEQISN